MYKLCKAIYEYKKATPAWYQELCTFLSRFKNSYTDSFLSIVIVVYCIMYLFVYVDDLILTFLDVEDVLFYKNWLFATF